MLLALALYHGRCCELISHAAGVVVLHDLADLVNGRIELTLGTQRADRADD
jgi:hypothetical protein